MSDTFAKTLNYLQVVLGKTYSVGRPKWFISFGALLYFVRDRNMGKPFKTDLDVSILGQIPKKEIKAACEMYGFELKSKIVDDRTGLPFQMVFEYRDRASGEKYSVDLFFWVHHNKYWWHTYDYHMEFTNKRFKGIPKEYVFKGTRESAMQGEIAKYNWLEIVPDVNFPKSYGTLLDIWYPNWIKKQDMQSQADKIVKLKTCVDLERKLK